MNLKKWKGTDCWDRALVLWKKNLLGCGLTNFEKTGLYDASILYMIHQSSIWCIFPTRQLSNSLYTVMYLYHHPTFPQTLLWYSSELICCNFVTFFFEREAIPLCIPNLYNVLCTVNTQHTSRQDAIITIRLYLATCLGRKKAIFRPTKKNIKLQ